MRLGLTFSGIVLIGIFLAWMLLKGKSAVQAWIDPNPLPGFGAWGAAWLCALDGAALLTRVAFRQDSSLAGEPDEGAPAEGTSRSGDAGAVSRSRLLSDAQ